MVETSGNQCVIRLDEEYDEGLKVVMFYNDHEGPKRCAVTGMLVGSACSLCFGTVDAWLREGGA